ncbi:MAG: N-6 DNA methylase [Candidatus Omnitrophica bacterium]|nr:N-6 DNA methylase [Candidatus Omnitrophota bacterium]
MIDCALPKTGPAREALREKGQFWTPDWVAEAMVGYVLQDHPGHVFDPAVGAGAFLRATKVVANELGQHPALLGAEVDPQALQQATRHGLSRMDLGGVEIRDFMADPPQRHFNAIVANPPYVRHHRLSKGMKERLKIFAARTIGHPLDGRAGLHIYFLLRALQLLNRGGRLAFIMPADTCEGVFAPTLWRWITSRYALEAVVAFTPDASPFPGVDTNALVFFIKNTVPRAHCWWARCTQAGTTALKTWVLSGFPETHGSALSVCRRTVSEGLMTGLSRAPTSRGAGGPCLGDFARVVRGVATGANEFFLLTLEQASTLGIPNAFLRPAIARTRDTGGEEITNGTLRALRRSGRPTVLLALDGRPLEQFPGAVRAYLRHGETEGLPRHALLATRRPWYKMERRVVPPILFSYLGRRNSRFIRNTAGVIPLTGFLCVYPREDTPDFLEKLWAALRHPDTVANLALVGKSYGGGAIKVEPRALERLPLPAAVVSAAGLSAPMRYRQQEFCALVGNEASANVRDRHGKPKVARGRHRVRRLTARCVQDGRRRPW